MRNSEMIKGLIDYYVKITGMSIIVNFGNAKQVILCKTFLPCVFGTRMSRIFR